MSFLMLCLSWQARAYGELDSLEQQEEQAVIPYFSYTIQAIETGERTIIERGFSAGITLYDKLNLGVFSNWNTTEMTLEKLGLPRELTMKYIHGGVLTSYQHRLSRKLSFTVGTRVGQGSVRVLNAGDQMDVSKRTVVIMHPDVSIEFSPARRASIGLNIGYRLMTDMKMQEIVKGDLTGLAYGLQMKFRLIKSKRNPF